MNQRIRIIYHLFVFLLIISFSISCVIGGMAEKKKLDRVVDKYIALFGGITLKEVDNHILSISIGEPIVEYTYEDKEYKERQSLYNDKGWNKTLTLLPGQIIYRFTMPVCDFVSVNVYTDTRYDINHGAKEPLNDIVKFMSSSPYKFIQSRFSKCYNIGEDVSDMYNDLFADDLKWIARKYFYAYIRSTFGETSSALYPIEKTVDKLLPEDLILLSLPKKGSLAFLYFVQPPESPGEYNITVEMVGTNGITYSATTTMTFE